MNASPAPGDPEAQHAASAPPFALTLFDSVHATSAARSEPHVRAVRRLHRQPAAPRIERGVPLVQAARFGDHRTDKGALRHDANVLAITGIEGDYDGGEMPLELAAEKVQMAGIRAVFYTSPSHTPERPRWRVVAPLSREHPPEARAPFVARMNGVLGGVLANESFTLSQCFYFGRVNGAPYESRRTEGSCIDELDELDSIAVDNRAKPDAEQRGPPRPTTRATACPTGR